MYIRGTRQRRCVRTVSRKWRAEPSHMASVAPPARIWDDSPHDSRTVCRRSSRVRAPHPRKSDPTSDILVVPGGGAHFPSFGHFWGTIAGTARAVSIWSTFGQKIFFDRTAVSSRRLSTDEYQSEFFSEVCSLSRAQPAHARSTLWGQLQHQK